jgi:tetratricopeptide (TPR) repeat protein
MKEARRLVAVALLSLSYIVAEDSAALNRGGAQALAAGDLKSALAQFQKAARLEPKNLQIQFNIGLTLIRSGHPEKAIPILERLANDPALANEARYLIGSSYFQLLDYGKAADVLKDLTEGPRAEHVLYMLEESNRLQGRLAEAREAFRQLNRRFPDSAWTHFLLGVAYENQAELDKAIEEYKTALARDPKLPNGPFAIGYLYWRQHDSETAKSWLENQVAAQPCHALAVFYLGQIARAAQDTAEAAKYYRRSISCDADSPEAHLRLGMTLAEMNQNEEALRELTRAVKLAPENPAGHYRLGLLYKKMGRLKESSVEYETVRRLQEKEGAEPAAKP